MLGNNQNIGFVSYYKDCFLPLVHLKELINDIVEFGKSMVKDRGPFAKQKNEDSSVVMGSIGSYLVERLAKVLVSPRHFLEFK